MSKPMRMYLRKSKSITFTLRVKNKVFKCLGFKAKNKNELTHEVLESVAGILRATVDAHQDLKGVYNFKIMNGKNTDIFNVAISPKKKVA